MDRADIELHVRQETDLAALRALARALEQRGETPTLTVSAQVRLSEPASLPVGPLPCRVRVLVEGERRDVEAAAETRVVIEDRMSPPALLDAPSDTLARADLIFVPGPAHLEHYARRYSGKVVEVGLVRLDPLRRDLEGERKRARAALGLHEMARVALYDASAGAQALIGEDIASLAAADWSVLIRAHGPSSALHELAANVPGLARVEPTKLMRALAAADVVIGELDSLLFEAAALNKGVVRIESSAREADPQFPEIGPRIRSPQELAPAVESVRPATPAAQRFATTRTRCRNELLCAETDSAARMAAEIQHRYGRRRPLDTQAAHDSQAESFTPVRDSERAEHEFLERVRAKASFGDTQGALDVLTKYLRESPSTRGFCLLASIQRRAGNLEAAQRGVQRAEPMAREDLALALCERARVHVDAGELGAALAAFEEAKTVSPASLDPWVGLGSLALNAKDVTGAEQYFRQALDREKSSRVWAGLGLALVGQQRGREALACFESALDLEPESLSAIYGLVQAAFQSGDIAAAERRVRVYVELHSGNLDLVFTLAGLRCQLGDQAGAWEMVERIELFKPDYPGLAELKQKLES